MSANAEIKVLNNVLSGKIKVISANGRAIHWMGNVENNRLSHQRLRNSVLLVKLIQTLKTRQHLLVTAKKKIIQIQIDSITRS
jgi:hypothetical protein